MGVIERKIIATYSGLRPRSKENNDYQIRFNDEKTFATLGAIRSTGLTASRGVIGLKWWSKNCLNSDVLNVFWSA